MSIKVVLVTPSKTTKEIEIKEFEYGNKHLNSFYKEFGCGKATRLAFQWGDFLYRFKRINDPIRLFNDMYQIIELEQIGHYYIVETSDDDGNTWDFLERSKSYTDYDDCYNSMKQEATSMLASEIDITQDFDFAEENTHSMLITFGHDYIVYKYSGKLMRFTMRGDW